MTTRERAEAALERARNGERTRDLLEELEELAEKVDDEELRQRLTVQIYTFLDEEPALFVDDPAAFFDELLAADGFEEGALITFSAVAEEPPAAFDDHVEELLRLLTSANDLKRGLALRCLYHVAKRNPRAVSGAVHAVRACLDDPNARVRGTACLTLGYLESAAARPALEERTRDESQYVREAAAWAMARLEDADTETEPIDSWDRSAFEPLDPTTFEELVGDLWDAMGYRTTVTAASRDGGVDVIAERGAERVAIQVKRYVSGPVSGPETKQLGGQLELDFDRAVLVTSSGFTAPAEGYADDADRVELVDGVALCDLLDLHGFDPESYRSV